LWREVVVNGDITIEYSPELMDSPDLFDEIEEDNPAANFKEGDK
jgi:hypothetical protein